MCQSNDRIWQWSMHWNMHRLLYFFLLFKWLMFVCVYSICMLYFIIQFKHASYSWIINTKSMLNTVHHSTFQAKRLERDRSMIFNRKPRTSGIENDGLCSSTKLYVNVDRLHSEWTAAVFTIPLLRNHCYFCMTLSVAIATVAIQKIKDFANSRGLFYLAQGRLRLCPPEYMQCTVQMAWSQMPYNYIQLYLVSFVLFHSCYFLLSLSYLEQDTQFSLDAFT